jgi:toxin ParE1/3/4
LADLNGILDFIALDRPSAAQRLVDSLVERCSMLAQYPEAGTRCEDIAAGLRYFSGGTYVIYYRMSGDTVRIERVLHGARDAATLFGKPTR